MIGSAAGAAGAAPPAVFSLSDKVVLITGASSG